MYPKEFSTSVAVDRLSGILEGRSRPGHFQRRGHGGFKASPAGSADTALFGKKDYQQLRGDQPDGRRLATSGPFDRLPDHSRKRWIGHVLSQPLSQQKEREEALKIYQALYLGRELVSGRVMKSADQL